MNTDPTYTGPSIIQICDEERAAQSWPRFVDDEWFDLSEGKIDLVDGKDNLGRSAAQIVTDATFDAECPVRIVAFDPDNEIATDQVIAASGTPESFQS